MDQMVAKFDPKTLSPGVIKQAKKYQAQIKDGTTKCYMDDVLAVLFA